MKTQNNIPESLHSKYLDLHNITEISQGDSSFELEILQSFHNLMHKERRKLYNCIQNQNLEGLLELHHQVYTTLSYFESPALMVLERMRHQIKNRSYMDEYFIHTCRQLLDIFDNTLLTTNRLIEYYQNKVIEEVKGK